MIKLGELVRGSQALFCVISELFVINYAATQTPIVSISIKMISIGVCVAAKLILEAYRSN